MTKKEYKNLKKIIDKVEDEALTEGIDITSSDFQYIIKELLKKKGFSSMEYEEAEAEAEAEEETIKKEEAEKEAYVSKSLSMFKGLKGKDGNDGQRGPMGLKGDTGERGPIGLTGKQGPQGIKGVQGKSGKTFLRGKQGEKGEKGDKGDSVDIKKIKTDNNKFIETQIEAQIGSPLFGKRVLEISVEEQEKIIEPVRRGLMGVRGEIGRLSNLISEGGGTFLELTDTPDAYTDKAGQYAKVNAGEDALEFGTPAGGGDVVGPGSATDNAIARFSLTTGKLIQNSVVTIADTTGNMAGVGTLGCGAITTSGTLVLGANNITTTGSLGATGAGKLTKGWFTDLDVTNAIAGSVTGNAGTVTNATLTTALTVNTGTLTLTADVGNDSILTIGGGAVSISGDNTGDQDLSGKADIDQTMYIGTTGVAINRGTGALTLAGITLTTPVLGTPTSGTLTNCDGTAASLVAGSVTGITLASGTLTLAGADALILTTSAATNVTLPTTGTLLANISEDASPELGGEMDCGAHSIGFTQQTATYDETTTTVDWRLGNKASMTFGAGNIGTFAFTNPSNPCNLLLKLIQDATGSRVVTAWDADVKWPAGTAPTLTTTANAVDIVSFYYDGTNYHGNSSLAFSVPA